MMIQGRAWTFGDNVNTDVIYPGKYLAIFEPAEMARHCFELVYPDFVRQVKPGDIVVAGRYFGCGSSREQAATCLKYAGISCVIAESFARIYYRNAINLGLPIVACPGISKKVEAGQELTVSVDEGWVKNIATGEVVRSRPLPPFLLDILDDGGLIPHLKMKLPSAK